MSDTIYDPSLDPGDMRAAVRAFPDHLAVGWERGAAVDGFDLDASAFDGIVLCGMGGSAIGGDLVRGIVEPTSPLPFLVNRGYALPGWVGEKTLVVASSYSGGTEETLAAFADAKARGARRLAITSGGTLAGIAEADGLDVVTIPGGLQPRAALGYSLGVVLRLARKLGLAKLSDAEFATALASARDRAEANDVDDADTPARALAAQFDGMLPVIYTGVGLLESVGMRWRTQIHENAKHPAVGNVLPEMDHNEIMGFEAAPAALASAMHVVALRDADDRAYATLDAVTAAVTEDDLTDTVTLTFPRPDADSAAVALRFRSSLLTTVLLYEHMLAGQGARGLDWIGQDMASIGSVAEFGDYYLRRLGLRVEVEEDGVFREVGRVAEAGPIAWAERAVVIPVTDEGEHVRVRLRFVADGWRIDRATLAEVRTVTPERVPLAEVTADDGAEMPALAEQLATTDLRHAVRGPGSVFHAAFRPTPAPDGQRQTFFVSSQGHYIEWMRPDWLRRPDQGRFVPNDSTMVSAIGTWRRLRADYEARFESSMLPVR